MKAFKSRISQGEQDFWKWMWCGLFSFATRAGRIIAKVLNFYALPEAVDYSLWQAVKSNTRSLTPIEEQEAKRIWI